MLAYARVLSALKSGYPAASMGFLFSPRISVSPPFSGSLKKAIAFLTAKHPFRLSCEGSE
jgi:hypothetical protein